MRERRTYGSVRGLRREPLVYSTIYPTRFKFDTPSFTMDIAVCLLERSFYVQINSYTKTYDSL